MRIYYYSTVWYLVLICALVFLFAACAGVIISEEYQLVGSRCQTAEVTTSWQGITMPTACKSEDPIHLVATPGHSTMKTVETTVKTAILGGVIGYGLTQIPDDFGTDIIISGGGS